MKSKVNVAQGNDPTTLLPAGLWQSIVIENASDTDLLLDLTGEGTFVNPASAAGITLKHSSAERFLFFTAERNKYLPFTKVSRALHAGTGTKEAVVQAKGRAT